MTRKEKSFRESLIAIKKAGITIPDQGTDENIWTADGFREGVSEIIKLLKANSNSYNTAMFCFIMYDIEDNKVRRLVAKFLIKKGCVRIQKSVFFGHLDRKLYIEISDTLAEVQEMYDNNDTIFLLPVNTDNLNSGRCIGQQFDFRIMTEERTTIFI